MCEFCQLKFRPVNINGVSKLKKFNGYTIDFRLQQFRKVIYGKEFKFIEFGSPKGIKLLEKMHRVATK